MSIKSDIPQISFLRERVERRFGRRLQVHADFLALVAEIESVQRQHISETTLERVWGYSTRGYGRVSLRTLDVLARYAGCESWTDMCEGLRSSGGVESETFSCASVRSCDLHAGDRLRIGWQPDRVCVVRYLGDNRFVAEECENAKMRVGATFSCLQFQLGRELVLDDFVNGDTASLPAGLPASLPAGENDTAAHGSSVHDTSVKDTSAHDTSAHDTSVHDTSVHDTSAHDTSVHDTSAHTPPAHSSSAHTLSAHSRYAVGCCHGLTTLELLQG